MLSSRQIVRGNIVLRNSSLGNIVLRALGIHKGKAASASVEQIRLACRVLWMSVCAEARTLLGSPVSLKPKESRKGERILEDGRFAVVARIELKNPQSNRCTKRYEQVMYDRSAGEKQSNNSIIVSSGRVLERLKQSCRTGHSTLRTVGASYARSQCKQQISAHFFGERNQTNRRLNLING